MNKLDIFGLLIIILACIILISISISYNKLSECESYNKLAMKNLQSQIDNFYNFELFDYYNNQTKYYNDLTTKCLNEFPLNLYN